MNGTDMKQPLRGTETQDTAGNRSHQLQRSSIPITKEQAELLTEAAKQILKCEPSKNRITIQKNKEQKVHFFSDLFPLSEIKDIIDKSSDIVVVIASRYAREIELVSRLKKTKIDMKRRVLFISSSKGHNFYHTCRVVSQNLILGIMPSTSTNGRGK